tara:strand:+ start:782 stop:946 length:165 start_codon:yes stop_codon:yes gene_type:complete
MTKTEIAIEFGKISGNLNFLIKRCKNDFDKDTLKETSDLTKELFNKINEMEKLI